MELKGGQSGPRDQGRGLFRLDLKTVRRETSFWRFFFLTSSFEVVAKTREDWSLRKEELKDGEILSA